MKHIIKRTLGFAFVLFSFFQNIEAENICLPEFSFEQVSGNGCCYYMSYLFDDPDCESLTYTTITVTTEAPHTANIIHVTPGQSEYPFSAEINGGGSEVVFTSPVPFNQTQGLLVNVGEICFADAPTGTADYEVLLTGMSVPIGNFGTVSVDCESPALPVPFNKYYGDEGRNYPEGVKAFDDGVYVIGANVDDNGLEHGTFSKFDIATGNLIWDIELDHPSRLTDFEYIPSDDAFLLVGRTEPSNTSGPQDNESLLIRVFDDGTVEYIAGVQYPGRETFNKILRHPNPVDLVHSYYFVGTKNPTSDPAPPSATDVIFVYNIESTGELNWIREYDYTIDDEFHRGIFPLSNGNLVLLGNDSPTNDGIMVEINGSDGSVVQAVKLETGIDIYGGVELPDGNIAIAGHYFTEEQGMVALLNSSFSPLSYLSFDNIDIFREIGLGTDGSLYVTGPAKSLASPYPVVLKIDNPPTGLEVGYAKYLDDGETGIDNGHLSVTPQHDFIFYTDERENNIIGFGETDILVGSFKLDLAGGCTHPFTPELDLDFTISASSIEVEDMPIPLGSPTMAFTHSPLEYECINFCEEIMCEAEFDWFVTPDCFVLFQDMSNGDVVSWEWTFDGVSYFDNTTPNPVWQFPPFPFEHEACLTITTSDGCMDTHCEDVIVFDQIPPIIECPQNLTINTDPGICCKNYVPDVEAIDNCGLAEIMCEFSGATQGTGQGACFNVGVTTVECTAIDFFGNESDPCFFEITVEDNEMPTIDCPENMTIDVPGCSDGQIVVFPMATAQDNCELESIDCNFQSGDFFPCGQTEVICTAIDIYGNENNCSFFININGCQNCAEVVSSSVTCDIEANCFDFELVAENLTSLPFSSATVLPGDASGIVFGFDWNASTGTATGTICMEPPLPLEINIDLNFEFACNSGPINCTLPYNMTTPCCEEITLDNQMFCSTDDVAYIPLNGCGDLFNVQQINWYYAYMDSDGNCPSPPFGSPSWSQLNPTGNACDDLLILPNYLDGDICVYAEVYFYNAPCQVISTNIAQVIFCEPMSCSISGAEDYCDTGSPVTVSPLIVSASNTDCDVTFQWYDENGNAVPGATGNTYQPGTLSHIPGNNGDCFTTYTFSVEANSLCGTQTCSASIDIFNENAPAGNISLYYPGEPMPYCPGQDATLLYEGNCIGPAPEYDDTWTWYISNSSGTGPWESLDLSGGTISNYFNTNQLFQDTWYRVERINGACGIDEATFFIDIYASTEIISFAAEENSCEPDGVEMSVEFLTDCPDGVFIDWYKDGMIVSTAIYGSSPAEYIHNTAEVAGNYYAVVRDVCCEDVFISNVVIIGEPWQVALGGDCFRCNNEDATLEGLFADLPIDATCTYQWYEVIDGSSVPISGATNTTLTVDHAGVFVFEADCDGCIKEASYNLIQCGDPTYIGELFSDNIVEISPNPFSNVFTISTQKPIEEALYLNLSDVNGEKVYTGEIQVGGTVHQVIIEDLIAGIYTLEIKNEKGITKGIKLVKI